LKLLGGGWRPFGIDEISRDLENAAKSAERAFKDAAKTLQTTCQFEVVRGSMAETIASISRAGDIIMLAEPESLAEFATPQSLTVVDAALRSAAAVLLVPSQIARHSGAIMAIATEPDDPSIEVAQGIAVAAKEELVIVETFKSAGTDVSIRDPVTKIRVRRIPIAQGRVANASEIGSALDQVRERLIVMTRSDECPPWPTILKRQVPILIVEPPRKGGESRDSIQCQD
jgi:RES domain-containing protein